MRCTPFVSPDGKITGYICGPRRPVKKCSACKVRDASLECDFPLAGKKLGKTCDAALCASCATEKGPNRHYCPPHDTHDRKVRSGPPRDPLAFDRDLAPEPLGLARRERDTGADDYDAAADEG